MAPVELTRKRPSHFSTHSAQAPGLLPTLGDNHAPGFEPLAGISVIPLAPELGVGQHPSDTRPRDLVLAEASSIAGQRRPAHFPSRAAKGSCRTSAFFLVASKQTDPGPGLAHSNPHGLE